MLFMQYARSTLVPPKTPQTTCKPSGRCLPPNACHDSARGTSRKGTAKRSEYIPLRLLRLLLLLDSLVLLILCWQRSTLSSSHSGMRDAESHLIDSGVRWWCQWSRCKQSVSVSFSDVGIGQGMHIHTAEYKYGGAAPPPATPDGTDLFPLVCMHGFGTGLGIFYAALPALAERWRSRVYAIDSLGCGLSSRPRYSGLGQASANDEDVKRTESFFVEGIERWRAAQSIDRMVLCGHSIGGYLAVAYAERYPERVERLLLVSAVGVPAPPPELASAHAEAPFLFQMVLGAWRSGWSPFTVAKLGLGSTILRGYVHNRFSGMPVRGSNRGDDRLVCC